jgi:adenosylcobinamide-GDP ribazoletransferase
VSEAALPAPLRGVRAAFAFLTRIPVGGFPYAAEDWAWSSAYFPLVGLTVGAVCAVLRAGLAYGLGDGLATGLLVIGASMLLTGAFHEDGLADTADALGGAMNREQLFTILKDSRIGSFGGAALVVSIGARAALVADLGPSCLWALPLAGCAARVGPVWLMRALPYATPAQAKSAVVARAGLAQAVVATAWLAVAALASVFEGGLSPARLAAMVGVLAVVIASAGALFRARAGGVTGDLLGAAEQASEIAALAVLAWNPRL